MRGVNTVNPIILGLQCILKCDNLLLGFNNRVSLKYYPEVHVRFQLLTCRSGAPIALSTYN